MKCSQSYISIIAISFGILGMGSCKNSAAPKCSQNKKAETTTFDSIQEISIKRTEGSPSTKDSNIENDLKLPQGYTLYERIKGDLNGDGIDDQVLMIKGTKEENIVIDRFDRKADRNRRGVLIYLTDADKMVLTTKNLDCFLSENEDGGVYFAPVLSMEIKNGKLFFRYDHGRYGHWKYTFKYQNSDFELIGYDASENYAQTVHREKSFNFLTKRKLIRKNISEDTEVNEDAIFEETWEDIQLERLYSLSKIKDFEALHITLETKQNP
ncbi:hypothetical protein ACFQ1M_04610 [Sungkyunkwania multivorans]|uniref:Lipoprotein n=1 Tax=Sungkyunkwania multivorans TaxID=1173618 RepID=A0ABW3CWC4_9FLAO